MINFLKKNGSSLTAFALVIGLAAVSAIGVHAAEDPMVTSAVASGTALVADNKGTLMTSVVTNIGIGFIITLTLAALGYGFAKIKQAFGGKRRKR